MTTRTMRVASVGIGWWSDVLAAAAQRTDGRVEVASCFTRSPDKRQAFAEKFGCASAESFEDILADESIDGIINSCGRLSPASICSMTIPLPRLPLEPLPPGPGNPSW